MAQIIHAEMGVIAVSETNEVYFMHYNDCSNFDNVEMFEDEHFIESGWFHAGTVTYSD